MRRVKMAQNETGRWANLTRRKIGGIGFELHEGFPGRDGQNMEVMQRGGRAWGSRMKQVWRPRKAGSAGAEPALRAA